MNYVNIFNNVLLSNTNQYPIEGGNAGIENKIINNIMNKTLRPSNLDEAIISNNIFNATGAELNNIFVNASAGDFKLKSTASNAIDKGISVGIYDENVSGLPDLGAIEYVSALPVSLTIFSGKTTQTGNLLKWVTQSETNNEGFAILRSVDGGLNFNQIGFVPSQSPNGNSSKTYNYTFLDSELPAKAFYKLLQTDFNGTITPSNIIFLKSDFVVESNIYPNPFTNEINVSLNNEINNVLTFSIFDVNGKLVYNKSQKALINTRIGLQNQPLGWYILTVTDFNGKVLLNRKVLKK
ncbi:MAG: T9SS C-terminal target domain-containing protein [Sphingobacteriales bacterium]|nr:MAG: T9SS C-terminal target domain-containing protein [Sphingobacteriales bacterium]